MKKINILIIIALFISNIIYAQFPKGVKPINVIPNKTTTINGNLSDGVFLPDLSWASRSSTACFPATQNNKFTGTHILYGFKIPEYSEVFITVIPKDKSANFSIYGYQVGENRYPVVPNLNRCVACEADYKWDYKKVGKTQNHTRTIRFNSTTYSYNIFIGVTGANRLEKGEFTLEIKLISRVKNTNKQEKLTVYSVASKKGKTLAYSGSLAEGTVIQDLSWAAKSSVACFPATENSSFTGKHIFYVTEIPKYSKITVTLIPKDKLKNLSLYGYMIGKDDNTMVTNLHSCISCEASYKTAYKKIGYKRSIDFMATNHSYRIVIGVAGANGLQKGDFTLQIKTE